MGAATAQAPTLQDWTVDPETSSIVVEARSSMGPISWEVLGPAGSFRVAVNDGEVLLDPQPMGELAIDLRLFRSGNSLYDAELAKRLDVRLFPEAVVRLLSCSAPQGAPGAPLRAVGEMTLHGETRTLEGVLEVSADDDGIAIVGVQQIDIREFGIPAPQMLMLKIFPEVRVHLFLRGTLVGATSAT